MNEDEWYTSMPVRNDIQVIPADEPRELKLGWIVHESYWGIVQESPAWTGTGKSAKYWAWSGPEEYAVEAASIAKAHGNNFKDRPPYPEGVYDPRKDAIGPITKS